MEEGNARRSSADSTAPANLLAVQDTRRDVNFPSVTRMSLMNTVSGIAKSLATNTVGAQQR